MIAALIACALVAGGLALFAVGVYTGVLLTLRYLDNPESASAAMEGCDDGA